jgi:glycosyltransferase involved in cell wall biosynthesis
MDHVAFFSSNRIVAVNGTMREEILKAAGKHKEADVRVLFNNIPVLERSLLKESFHAKVRFGMPDGAKMLVTAGVLTPGKNFEILLKSLSQFSREDVFLLLIGDCTDKTGVRYRESLRHLVEELGLGRRVILTGWLQKEELWGILSGADLFVLPSKSEGMPNALLEALGCDLPCLGSDVPGVKEVLQYDELLFDPSDQEGLTRKIENILWDKDSMEKVKRLCQERLDVFRFDWGQELFDVATMDLKNPHGRPLRTNPEGTL